MESKVLSKEVEWEARRVATAFGIQQIIPTWNGVEYHFCGETTDGVSVTWEIEPPSTHWTRIRVFGYEEFCMVNVCKGKWYFGGCTTPYCKELMAYGIYRLGFEDEGVWRQLPPLSLTAHEKLELRLSMPREFCPQKWLDEAQNV